MEILSFENNSKPARRKTSAFIGFVTLAIAGFSVLGTTLASSITIGSSPITFGQGSIQAVACDSSITVTPAAAFANASGSGSFKLGSITVSNLDNAATNSSTGAGCGGKTLIIKVWDDSNTTALTLAGSGGTAQTAITSAINSTIGSTTTSTTGVTVASGGAGSLTYTITSPVLDATSIYKITVEQQN